MADSDQNGVPWSLEEVLVDLPVIIVRRASPRAWYLILGPSLLEIPELLFKSSLIDPNHLCRHFWHSMVLIREAGTPCLNLELGERGIRLL